MPKRNEPIHRLTSRTPTTPVAIPKDRHTGSACDDVPHDIRGRRTEGHPDSKLLRSLFDRIGDNGEHAERAKTEPESGEHANDHGTKNRGRAVASRPIPDSERTLLTGQSRSTRAIAARTSAVRLFRSAGAWTLHDQRHGPSRVLRERNVSVRLCLDLVRLFPHLSDDAHDFTNRQRPAAGRQPADDETLPHRVTRRQKAADKRFVDDTRRSTLRSVAFVEGPSTSTGIPSVWKYAALTA